MLASVFLPRLRPLRSIIPQSKARKEAHEKIKEDQAGKALVVVVFVQEFFLPSFTCLDEEMKV